MSLSKKKNYQKKIISGSLIPSGRWSGWTALMSVYNNKLEFFPLRCLALTPSPVRSEFFSRNSFAHTLPRSLWQGGLKQLKMLLFNGNKLEGLQHKQVNCGESPCERQAGLRRPRHTRGSHLCPSEFFLLRPANSILFWRFIPLISCFQSAISIR